MNKPPAKIIKATANSAFMQGVKRDFGLTQRRITEIAFDYVYSGTKLSLVDFTKKQAAA